MSASIDRPTSPASCGKAGIPNYERLGVLLVVLSGVGLQVASGLASSWGLIDRPSEALLRLFGILILGTFAFYAFSRTEGFCGLKRLVLVGLSLVFVGQCFDLASVLSWFTSSAQWGVHSEWATIVRHALRIVGYCLLFPSLFLAVWEVVEIQNVLKRERIDLLNEIERRQETEQALRKSEELYRDLFEHASDIVYTIDLSGGIQSINKKAEELTGFGRNEANNIFDLVSPAFSDLIRRRIQERIEGSAPDKYEIEIVKKNGEILPLEINTRLVMSDGKPIGIQGIARDVSERRRAEAERRALEERIQKAQKTESLGVLAGGIAHDFNNLLMGVLGNAGLALHDLEKYSPARESIEQIQVAAQRAADLARQMLDYSGKGHFVREPMDLNEVVEETAHLLKSTLHKKAEVHFHLNDSLPPIEGDPTQIRQVILNLLTNAGDAIHHGPGKIEVLTGWDHFGKESLSRSYLEDETPEGEYVFLDVTDNGCGMDEETLGKMFDPFFSRKETGRGLGLSAVLGIVRGHGGAIFVQSVPGRGTSIRVLFPSSKKTLPKVACFQPSGPQEVHSGTVLVIDDEEVVRNVTERMLQKVGFNVLKASNGEEGVQLFKTHRDRVDLVLLDLTMPHMDGKATLTEIRKIHPKALVLMSSGYTEEEVSLQLNGSGPSGFIQKPYRDTVLADKVRELLHPVGQVG